ncbi:Hypothetical predicted protein [Mytilus galloprovincialis]|uniref:Uncharacterized protein n=1 Tax=Mytilus galloprovincialis TaxID=29158 RepID=A0A8B6HEA9_MYTGA|nr:Hypothetical predicted protein [Mytilus galloprovincialis]
MEKYVPTKTDSLRTTSATPDVLHTPWTHIRDNRQREIPGAHHQQRPHQDKSDHSESLKDTCLLTEKSCCYQDNSPRCVTKLLDQLLWESLQHRRWKQSLVLCYKTQYQLIAIDPAKYYTIGDSKTRGNHKLRQTRVKRECTTTHSFQEQLENGINSSNL